MAGEWLAATANANMFTYEIAPVFIMMEHTVLLKMREVIGWEEGDSILAPGGSISNMYLINLIVILDMNRLPRYAVIIARHKQFPEHKQRGMRAIPAQLICYTSKHVRYDQTSASTQDTFTEALNIFRPLPSPTTP